MLDFLRNLPPGLVLTLVFLIPALEASTMLGVIFPGEVTILVGGAVAHAGGVPLWSVITAGVAGAILGDLTGYLVGRRYGRRLIPRKISPQKIDKAAEFIRERGGPAVFLGRFTALLRALVPGVAGISGMTPARFLPYNAAGGVVWATGVTLIGYAAGASLKLAEQRLGLASEITLAVLVVAGTAIWLRARRVPRS
ncbi:membrane protein [Lentzea sp. NBRC 105346]|uniref:DedA family protein n=1 Tax=Lentzea sp. NBRC 105346 TaxID=3032205 RepID=UPI0024A4BDF3|nr:DedA family protein [Lentzea sp. NBRC 105346]GLZ28482.1 membrane protein [Lentzea sp. NBRC 105346]